MKLAQVKNKGQLKELLLKMGLSKEIAEHKAFDKLIEEFIINLDQISLVHLDLNDETAYVSFDGKAIQINSYAVEDHKIGITITVENGQPKMTKFVTSQKKGWGANNTCAGSLSEKGELVITREDAYTSTDQKEKKTNQSATRYISKYDSLGIETYRGFETKKRTLNNGFYNGIAPFDGIAKGGTEWEEMEAMRQGIDFAWVRHQVSGKNATAGYTMLSNEYGLQSMEIKPGFYGDYIDSTIPTLSEEEYARKIVDRNSPWVRDALRKKYKPADRINFEWTRETTSSKSK